MSNGFGSWTVPGLSNAGNIALGQTPTAATGAGGGTTETEGFPWAIVIPIVVSLLQTMFKKSPSQEAEDLKKQMAILGLQTPYQSPYMSTIDPTVLKALLAQLGRTSNWGWPAGKGIDTSFIQEALANVGNINPQGTSQTTPLYSLSRGQLGG